MKYSRHIPVFILAFLLTVTTASASVRLKDVAKVRDQREIQLTGLGLVVGLAGTGDNRNTQFTIRMVGNMMKRMGIEVPSSSIKVKNVAAVMVTATVSPYIKEGGTFDVTVSSTGDASSIDGGTLLITNVMDNNGNVYAKAQGPISVGGPERNLNAPSGVIPNGGILLREVPTLGMDERNILVTLLNPDYTTAYRLSTAINETIGGDVAIAQDAGSIIIDIPDAYSSENDMVRFIAEIESVRFTPDERARVVINERTGTIIAGGHVSLGPVAITHGDLSLTIQSPAGAQATQAGAQAPMPGAQAQAGERIVSLAESANVNEVAQALNLMGVTPNDLISIFQALRKSGSLRAELLIM